MLLDAVPFRETLHGDNVRAKAFTAFTEYLEKKLGVRVVLDLQNKPSGRTDLLEPIMLAELLKKKEIITSYSPSMWPPDEVPMEGWFAFCNLPNKHQVGGTTWESSRDALYATVSEALERYIWMSQTDYFVNPVRATATDIAKRGTYIAPEDFVGFTDEQRRQDPRRELKPDAQYLWIQGVSLIHGKRVYLPAQVVSGVYRSEFSGEDEPVIRQPNTNGLATWPTQAGARLRGALELIEREAYMVMWLNQLTLPRIALRPLCKESPSLSRTIAKCERYRFKTHVIQLLTDAPAHAVAVVMEDATGNLPRYTVGLNAHTSLPRAIEKAMTEALRSYRGHRLWVAEGNAWDTSFPVEKIGHRDRLYYWGHPENAKHLEFMLKGPEIVVEKKPWDENSAEEHLEKILRWLKGKDFECVSVPLTSCAKNPTQLHIEMVVVPQLLPTYLHETSRQFGGERWHEIPRAFSYKPREKPFAARPHPFS